MSVADLANTLAKAIQKARDENGKAQQGVYNDGYVTVDSGTYGAVTAVPVNLYNGKQVWVQVTATGSAVIIGD